MSLVCGGGGGETTDCMIGLCGRAFRFRLQRIFVQHTWSVVRISNARLLSYVGALLAVTGSRVCTASI